MLKTIVFDLGGVLFAEGRSAGISAMRTKYGYNPDHIYSLLNSPEGYQLRAGKITDEDFWDWVEENIPEEYEANIIKQEWYQAYTINQDVFALIKELRGKYRLVVFSGNIKSRVEFLDKKYGFRSYFDAEVYSYEVGYNKPEREFTKAMLTAAEAKPDEILYIDDKQEYLTDVERLGVNVLLATESNTNQLLAYINKLIKTL